jgi:predicted phage baseplate assembly protein
VADDFEFFALQASRYVARAKCIQPRAMAESGSKGKAPQPGAVRVLIVPQVNDPDRRIEPGELKPSSQLQHQVQAYLDDRRLLTAQVSVEAPNYIPVSVRAKLRPERAVDSVALAAEAERRLYQFINPLVGGADRKGWPFGRGLNLAAVFAQLQAIAGIAEIVDVQLFVGTSTTPASTMAAGDDALIISGEHRIEVIG